MDLTVQPGTLLASAPHMLDPNFMHAVVLICQHTSEGAYGLVVNRRTTATVADLLPEHPVLGSAAAPVHWGGPVGSDTLQILHTHSERVGGGLHLGAGVCLGGDLDELAGVVSEGGEEPGVRFVVGYAGWGEGQLDGELAEGGWLPTALDPGLVFQDDQQRTWREAIRAIGGEVAGMEDLPPDVSWN
ncbi:MAG: YqgE/AlgH family protein [Planctomycetota bacterium]|jgi:putative transcriptional regulator|nr:YqgE/AlgH family protein [Planctomycetota bacterium]MDP6762119.1 YqgE/AlgH family protein [Planctomycetota bacterium]MDP6989108.1 YqgE/AlgH family protein [Planctomycetota bacterium]